jgi:hypothetical protein
MLIYGLFQDSMVGRTDCQNCWEFGVTTFSIPLYSVAGLVLIGIGAIVFVTGKRQLNLQKS